MTTPRANALADILRGTGTLVIEDDSTGDLASDADVSLGQWIPEQTVHVRSYSKSHGPDLRLAAMSAPDGVMSELLGRRQLGQGWSSRLLQQILLSLLTDPVSIREVKNARKEYAARRARLAKILAAHSVSVSHGEGLNIWVPVRNETSAILRLAAQGMGVAPGQPFTLSNSEPHIRVSLGQAKSDLELLGEAIAAAALSDSAMISR